MDQNPIISTSPTAPLVQNQEGATSSQRTSWISWLGSWFGRRVSQTDPEPGQASRATIVKTVQEKFPITHSDWSGTKITIPKIYSKNNMFKGSSAEQASSEAKELLDQLTKLKDKGTLVLKKSWFTGKREFQYKDFSEDWFAPSEKQEKAATTYIESLITAAYPQTFPSDRKKIAQHFSGYISPLSTVATNKNLPELFQSRVDKAIANYSSYHLTAKTSEIIPGDQSPIDYLKTKGIKIDTTKPIGTGAFGNVYGATFNGKEYVYKEEKNIKPIDPRNLMEAELELNEKPWRDGDIAASRLKDLPHFAKSTLFILKIAQPGKIPKIYNVPTEEAKGFLKDLPPGTSITKLGQLIERAPGKDLLSLVNNPKNPMQELNPNDRVLHFNPIASQLFEFLEKSYDRNLIHRDLKLANLMFDADKNSPTYQRLTVIDFGLGGVYGKRSKMSSKKTITESHNPLRSKRFVGTPRTMAPAVLQGKSYGSEVDFHSVGVLLIELLVPRAFDAISKARKNQNPSTGAFKAFTSTRAYLDILAEIGEADQLAQIFEENPDMRTTIDLFFNVASAKNETDRAVAFNALKTQITTLPWPPPTPPTTTDTTAHS